MATILRLLEQHRLAKFYKKFLDLGVTGEQDLIDSITDENLRDLGFTQVEKTRFEQMKVVIQRLRVNNLQKAYCLQYTFPKCPQHKELTGLDPDQNTVDDLILRICHLEGVETTMSVCLYTAEGMPLTDDPFFNTWSLRDRHIENGSKLYVIFTPKENLRGSPQERKYNKTENEGPDAVRYHIMLRGDFEIKVDLTQDTLTDLRGQLSRKSGIPAHVLHYKDIQCSVNETLEQHSITEDSVVKFYLSSFDDETPSVDAFYHSDVTSSVQQTQKGQSVFFSALYAIRMKHRGEDFKKVIAYIRKLAGCSPLAQSLYQLVCRNEIVSKIQKIAIVEGLYFLFRELLPGLEKKSGDKIIEDQDVFEYANICWAYLISQAQNESSEHENYAQVSLTTITGRLTEPVRIPGTPEIFDRSYVLEKIEDNLGVYLGKDKATFQNTGVFDCLPGKKPNENVDVLAHKLRDVRADQSFRTSRTQKEAIVVLFDSSISMGEECFDTHSSIKRIDAIKEIFSSFANRTMAYDFHHIICLVKFDTEVKTLHTFTENFETFKEHIRHLQASGITVLYDALNHGLEELQKVQQRFPDCRKLIICVTNGNDMRSKSDPVLTTTKLMSEKIVVDSVLIEKVENNVLHGISNVTGGCCFKPATSKEALQLFEMETVLSLELRKKKKQFDITSIRKMRDLTRIFETCGYDLKPEVQQPQQMNNKVTVTEKILKKKIMESKTGRFLEKDKRILEELKSLHCDPHPYWSVFPSETDMTSWRIVMQGPPNTPYENGTFELFCQFAQDYPVKPPLVRFITPVYHCNVSSVGRIGHNTFDQSYSAHITMREILNAVYSLLIAHEPMVPLDSVLAEEFMTDPVKYEEEAKKSAETCANLPMVKVEEKLVGHESSDTVIPPHLMCPLTKQLFRDPVRTKYGMVYERRAIEMHLKNEKTDPLAKKPLDVGDLRPDKNIKKLAKSYRRTQIETLV